MPRTAAPAWTAELDRLTELVGEIHQILTSLRDEADATPAPVEDDADLEARVLELAATRDRLTSAIVSEDTGLVLRRARRLLSRLVGGGQLVRRGGGASTRYVLPDQAPAPRSNGREASLLEMLDADDLDDPEPDNGIVDSILTLARRFRRLRTTDLVGTLGLPATMARQELSDLVTQGKLARHGSGRGTYYTIANGS